MTDNVVWEEFKDSSSGDPYYYNTVTGITTWVKPATFPYGEGVPIVPAVTAQPQPISWDDVPNTDWQIVKTTTNEVYYFNTKTNETTWEIPAIIEQYLEEKIQEDKEDENIDQSSDDSSSDSDSDSDDEKVNKKRKRESFSDDEDMEETPVKKQKIEEEEIIIDDESIIKQYEELLFDFNVNQFSSWDLVQSKLSNDERFNLIPSLHQKKKIFEEYAKDKAKQIANKREKVEKILNENLDKAHKDKITDFKIFMRKYIDTAVTKTLSEKEIKSKFDKKVSVIQKQKLTKTNENKFLFHQLLTECKKINYRSHWSDVKDIIRKDPRYEKISSSQREDIFYEYRDSLRKEQNNIRDNKKQHREHVNSRRDFEIKEAEDALLCLFSEFIKKPCSWDDAVARISDKRRFNNRNLSTSKKQALFKKHIDSLQQNKYKKFYSLLKDTIPPIAIGSIYETVQFRIQNDSRFTLLSVCIYFFIKL